jgi:small-conductance mechanosensitive channel
MMSGLVVVYSRSLKAGDVVRVNDIDGIVTEVGALSVKLANAKNEEFTIPNAVIVGTTVKNYSRIGGADGTVINTSVTIGYDAPWRVVYEMLLAAADRTTGIRKSPAPVVYQPVLSDFFVEYHLTGRLEPGYTRFVVLSELHQNIQDAFNERGVQIMSPHYEGQPSQPVVVPRARWSRAPGEAERPGGG